MIERTFKKKPGLLRRSFRFLLLNLCVMVLTVLVLVVVYLDSIPDLNVWHTARLDEEFTASSPVTSFSEYQALEDRLFQQLDDLVYQQTASDERDAVNRYHRQSLSDPGRWQPNWNRSYEWPGSGGPAVLLIHGMTDSPYSLRGIAERLHQSGAHVLGLRVPGHGTAPSGLVHVRLPDMTAAVRLAMMHLARSVPQKPLYIVGYSNGAALAVHYALETLSSAELPKVSGLVLLSPEIGLDPLAAVAVWQSRLGHWLGLDKLSWNGLLPEFDPFKYGSFAINAADVSYRITNEIQQLITDLAAQNKLVGVPPVLAFSSVVDATVLPTALVGHLFNRLPEGGGHRLVLFDINRQADIEHLLSWDPDALLNTLHANPHPSYDLSLVTNRNPDTAEVVERTKLPGRDGEIDRELSLAWPRAVYSLSHVALPFSPQDSLYGGAAEQDSPGIDLGDPAMRGERGIMKIPASDMLRLRWNPFYSYLEDSALSFMGLAPASEEAVVPEAGTERGDDGQAPSGEPSGQASEPE